MDGKYLHLNDPDHLKNIFLKDFRVTWDRAHRIELSITDSTSIYKERQSFIKKVSNTIQSTMKRLSYEKPFMELFSQKNISDHFLTRTMLTFMKFVGHCFSIIKSFGSNFVSIVSTLEKLNTHETEALQVTILSLYFILDYLFMSDVTSYLTNCSKRVQKSSGLPWIYPETIDFTLTTLKFIKDILKGEDLGTMSNSKGLFPIFFISLEMISLRQFKGCPLIGHPITATLTR